MADEFVAWHLKKEVSVGHIVSTLMLAGLLIAGYIDMKTRVVALEEHTTKPSHHEAEKRLDNLEQSVTRVDAVNAAMQIRLEDMQQEILRRLDRQDIKLDRIEDRLNKNESG